MPPRKMLADILTNSERDHLAQAWSKTAKANDVGPIPPGEYKALIADGTLFTAKSGTPGYKLTLEVVEGDFAGRKLWHDIWLSDAALPMAKRDLAKLGVERLEQLDRPLPSGIVLAAKVGLRRNDDGSEYNRIARFEVVEVRQPEADPFAPAPPKGESPPVEPAPARKEWFE